MNILRQSIILLAGFCSGCVALTSEIDDEGLVYHLPKSVLTISVWQHLDLDTGRKWYLLGGIAKSADAAAPDTATDEITSKEIPDPRHRYVIKYHRSAFSDDRLCMSRSPNGLLHDVQFAADDRTPQVIFNVARFLSGTFGGPRPAYFSQEPEKAGVRIRKRAYTAHVDPFEDEDVEAFNKALYHVFNEHIRLDVHRLREIASPSKEAWPDDCDDDHCARETFQRVCEPDNICYRTKLKLPLDLYLGETLVDRKYADIINAWDIGAISVTRALLVHKITKLRFQNGTLVAAVVRKPSEVEEFSLLPIHILNAALITPSGLWAAAFSSNNSQGETAVTQMAELTKQVANLETAVRALALGPTPTTIAGTETYNLNCKSPKRSDAKAINLLTGGEVDN